MLDHVKIIDTINKSCQVFFTESTFFLHPSKTNRFSISGSNTSKAINIYNNTQEQINVIKWFDDFWIYVDIRFENFENKKTNTFITLSIFQGDISDEIKIQLFRAEWDNFDNNDEHPQPHWHIYPNYSLEKSFSELAEMDEKDDFVSLLNDEKAKSIDLKRIHFAMNADWCNSGNHIHSINSEQIIVTWFQGLLSHIKSQLVYIK